jgi:erythromycin esterase-like protein
VSPRPRRPDHGAPRRLLLVALGVLIAGCGGGRSDQGPAISRVPPDSAAALAFTSRHAIPFDTAEPGHGFADLMPLKQVIGDARIVALGEGTHGTREFFQMKHRLTEFLASEMGFTVLAMEANSPEAERVNDYVQGGEGDPRALLKGMYFWMWDTQEVLDLIAWMRDVNRARPGRLRFAGFDMQTPTVAIEQVSRFVERADPAYGAEVARAYGLAKGAHPDAGGFGTAIGDFPVAACAGKRIHFFGWVKTEAVTRAYAGLWWRVDGASGVLKGDNMADRGLRGTNDWTRCEIALDVPAEAKHVQFGTLLVGNGTAWFDSLGVTIDGFAWSDPNDFDLDFESGSAPRGLSPQGPDYETTLDPGTAHAGQRSLRMRFTRTGGGTGAPGVTRAQVEAATAGVVRHLEQERADLIRRFAAEDVDRAIQNARVVLQCAKLGATTASRDRCMADNVRWILDHSPAGTKIVLWAHNSHVSRMPDQMGAYLDETYGRQMVVLGFAMNQGRYNAVGDAGVGPHDAIPGPPGSVESLFHATGLPRFILDLRQAPAGSPAAAWFGTPRPFRSIGTMAMDGFFPSPVSARYDGLIYFETTTASTLLF